MIKRINKQIKYTTQKFKYASEIRTNIYKCKSVQNTGARGPETHNIHVQLPDKTLIVQCQVR